MDSRRVGALLLVTVLGAACSKPASRSFECRCDYTTDTDVPGVQDVRVCVGEDEDPKGAAAECTTGLGVGQVDRCVCTDDPEPCGGPPCEQSAARAAR